MFADRWPPRITRAWLIGGALGAVALASAGVVALWSSGKLGFDPAEMDAEVLLAGRTLYQTHCASCHGADLEGQPNWQTPLPNGRLPAPPHDATGHTWHHPDGVLFRITRDGPAAVVGDGYESDMPGLAAFSPTRRCAASLLTSRAPGRSASASTRPR